jgi:DNA-binding HxlR family transcriptional regulator
VSGRFWEVGTFLIPGHLMETTPPWNVFDSHCPTRQVLDRVADKWSVLVVRRLSDGTLRFAQLRRSVGGISQKMLTNTLRGLERDGIVARRIYASVPPKVEYSLTNLGRSLCLLVEGICGWAEANIQQVQAARAAYERTHKDEPVAEASPPADTMLPATAARARRSKRQLGLPRGHSRDATG